MSVGVQAEADFARYRAQSRFPGVERAAAQFTQFGMYPITQAVLSKMPVGVIEGIVRKTGFIHAVYGIRQEYCFITPFGFFYSDSLFKDFVDCRITFDVTTREITILGCNV